MKIEKRPCPLIAPVVSTERIGVPIDPPSRSPQQQRDRKENGPKAMSGGGEAEPNQAIAAAIKESHNIRELDRKLSNNYNPTVQGFKSALVRMGNISGDNPRKAIGNILSRLQYPIELDEISMEKLVSWVGLLIVSRKKTNRPIRA